MKQLISIFLLFVSSLYAQDQTVELCERNNKTFRYTAVGSSNCTWQWQVFFNGSLAKTVYGETLPMEFSIPGKYVISLKIENEMCESELQQYTVHAIECRRPIVLVPTAFTPNHSGLNDVFKVEASHIQNIRIQIFNRWGTLFFVSTSLDIGWDGTVEGDAAPEGAYICLVEYVDVFGNFGQKITSLTLYR